jgi:Mg2+/Co2+ transporter CorB
MDIVLLGFLILLNGLLAMSEVALLTARQPRLVALARQGDTMAASAARLAADPTRFLSTIQIGITSIGLLNGIVGEAVLAAPLALWLQEQGLRPKPSAVVATTVVVVVVTYLSIVVGELVPKRLGQVNAEGVARLVAWPMHALALASAPFVHLLSASTRALLNPLMRALGIHPEDGGAAQALSPEEIRTIILESSKALPKKHLSILLNLFDLSAITVQDIMLPRARIESIRLDEDMPTVARHLATSYHMRLPVFRDARGDVLGVLHLRKVLSPLLAGTLDKPQIEALLVPPYFVPASTPVFVQLQYFQENEEHIALVVDEYGELMGLVTLEDIIEEIIGKFTTSLPTAHALAWGEDGSASVDGAAPVREVNRALGLELPTEGPKTMNGLILEHLRDIPEADVSMKIGEVAMEIVHAQGRTVKTVRVFRPRAAVEEVTEGP